MPQCEFCLNYDGDICTDTNGVKYDKIISDSLIEIDCPAYLEKGVAGIAGMGMF